MIRRKLISALVALIIFITGIFLCRGIFERRLDFLTDKYVKAEVDTDTLGFLDLDTFVSEQTILSKKDAPFQVGCSIPDVEAPRASAAFVVLARNSEVEGVVKSMNSLERHFNRWYNYPWVFLNDEPFSEEFKLIVQKHTKAGVEFGLIEDSVWNFDPSTKKDEITAFIQSQGDREILYGNLESYHKMCRFYSGGFYKHELVRKRDWFWRVEPDVEFYCDLTYDPFIEMEKRGKKYGFTVSLTELYYTVPNLFRETVAFIKKNSVPVKSAWTLFIHNSKFSHGNRQKEFDGIKNRKQILKEMENTIMLKKFLELKKKKDHHVGKLAPSLKQKLFGNVNALPTLYEDRMNREEYNLCHFWSNFEIARTDLFNSPTYEAYFKHLDESGGFYKERWGDAPVHSLAMGMLLNVEEIHYFRDIGYKHSTIAHCPANSPINQLHFDYKPESREDFYWTKPDIPKENGVGCRCRCPKNHRDIEDSSASCIRRWSEVASNQFKAFDSIDLNHWERIIESLVTRYLSTGGEIGGDSQIVDKLEW